jgi:CheY-like chemotaxis protein
LNQKQITPGVSDSVAGKGLRPLRIVVADDDYDAMMTLMVLLRDEGHEVRGVKKAADILAVVRRFEPHAVLCDINMPDLSGFEIARRIRTRHGDKRPLLIAISGVYKQGSDRILSEIAGFNHHVAKPYDIKQILALLAPLQLPDDGTPEATPA